MNDKKIIMNFTVPPSCEDLEVMAGDNLESLPEELTGFCEGLAIAVEDLPDETVETEMDLDDPYDLPALYKSGKEISPGVEKKVSNDEDVLVLYRRPILDVWAEAGDDLSAIIRSVMIEEIGRVFDFSDDEIEDMAERHYQGLL